MFGVGSRAITAPNVVGMGKVGHPVLPAQDTCFAFRLSFLKRYLQDMKGNHPCGPCFILMPLAGQGHWG
jgi:hypothetical protein